MIKDTFLNNIKIIITYKLNMVGDFICKYLKYTIDFTKV